MTGKVGVDVDVTVKVGVRNVGVMVAVGRLPDGINVTVGVIIFVDLIVGVTVAVGVYG